MAGPQDSRNSGTVPNRDLGSPVAFLRAEHREGKHAGRMLNGDCPDCYPNDSVQSDHGQPVWESTDPASVTETVRLLWEDLNRAEINKVLPKAVEYGAADLDLMGHALGLMLNSPRAREAKWTPAELQEMASAFYALGKVARVFGAFAQGQVPSEDCWHDLGVYARMVQVIRRRGGWM